MSPISELALSRLTAWYLLASTPGFLLRKFRHSALLESIAADNSVDDLLEAIDELASREEHTPRDVALAYGYLIALTLKPLLVTSEKVRAWGFGRLEWDRYIWEIHEGRAVATSEIVILSVPRVNPSVLASGAAQDFHPS
jgi:hypothetical protein